MQVNDVNLSEKKGVTSLVKNICEKGAYVGGNSVMLNVSLYPL